MSGIGAEAKLPGYSNKLWADLNAEGAVGSEGGYSQLNTAPGGELDYWNQKHAHSDAEILWWSVPGVILAMLQPQLFN